VIVYSDSDVLRLQRIWCRFIEHGGTMAPVAAMLTGTPIASVNGAHALLEIDLGICACCNGPRLSYGLLSRIEVKGRG